MNLLEFFDRAYVINLPERADRRREMERSLLRSDVGLRHDQIAERVHFFPAIRPAVAAPFPSVGVKGCSLSHLAVLQDAHRRGLARVLVLEDDAEFEEGFQVRTSPLLLELATRPWGVVQFGHLGGSARPHETTSGLVEFSGEVTGAHCYGVSAAALGPLVALFEAQHRGTPGDARHGPMPADGTINVFRWLYPETARLLVVPSAVGQRSSRSDITPSRVDRVPFLRPILRLARWIHATTRTR